MQYRLTHMPVTHIYPKGTYCKKIFYPRGDDIYIEPEWAEKEKRNLKAKYKNELKEYSRYKKEYDTIEKQLHDIDNYTLQVAERLGDESNSTTEDIELRKQIKELTQKVDLARIEIEETRKKTIPTSLSYLLKEIASYIPEYEANSVDRSISQDNIDNFTHPLCELTASDDYRHSVLSKAEYKTSIQCRNDLKNHLQTTQKNINTLPSSQNSENSSSANAISQRNADIFDLYNELIELKLNSDESILQKQLAATHRRFMVKSAFEEITELNDLFYLIGEKTVDLNEIRDNCDIEQIEAEEKEIAENEEKIKNERNDRPSTKKRNRTNK